VWWPVWLEGPPGHTVLQRHGQRRAAGRWHDGPLGRPLAHGRRRKDWWNGYGRTMRAVGMVADNGGAAGSILSHLRGQRHDLVQRRWRGGNVRNMASGRSR
jgi:hypothetical protein